MSDRLAIEFISTLGLPPPAHIEAARRLGCGKVGLGLAPIVLQPGRTPWSLRDDPALLRATAAALRDHAVAVSLVEGFMIVPGRNMAAAAADLDLAAELGATRINVLVFDPDAARAADQLALLAGLAAARGLTTVMEFLPVGPIATLAAALRMVERVGRPDVAVLVDLMHLVRSGGTAAELAAVPAGRIGYVQLCDVPLVPRHGDYGEEARHDRLPPGEGELPLADLLAAVPPTVTVGLEVPRLVEAQRGTATHDLLAGSVAAARRLLAGG